MAAKKRDAIEAKRTEAYSEPPQPPPFDRRIRISRIQLIGMPLIMLLPILTLLGVFGETTGTTRAVGTQLAVQVEYPARARYQMLDAVKVSVQNISAEPVPAIQVRFDRAYIEAFSELSFTPDVEEVTAAAYVVELGALQPQESRSVVVELQAERYWRHEGDVVAGADDGEDVRVSLDTLVFP